MSTNATLHRYGVRLTELVVPMLLLLVPPVILFLPLLLPSGYVFYGDELFYPWSVRRWSDDVFTTWSDGPTTNYQWIIQGFLWPAFSSLLGDQIASKAVWLVLAILPGFSAFLATSLLVREWHLPRTFRGRFVPVLAGLTYGLGFYNVGFTPLPSFSWIYIALPLLFAIFIKGLRSLSLRHALLFAGLTVLGSVNPLWVFDFALLTFPFVTYSLSKSKGSKSGMVGWLVLALCATLAFNAYWWFPTYGGYTLGAGGFFQSYTTQNTISYEQLRSASRWSVLDILLIGHPPFTFFYSYPRNWTLASLGLVILSFGALLTRFSKLPQVMLLQVSALVGVFFAKGVNPPFGEVYLTIAQNLPYGAGALLRNVGVSGWNTLLAYALLAPLTLVAIGERYNAFMGTHKHFAGHLKRRTFRKSPIVLVIGATLVVLPLVNGTLTDMVVYTYPHFAPRDIPSAYFALQAWLDDRPGTGKVLWIPSTGYYLWHGNDPLSAWPSVMSGKRAIQAPQFLRLSPFIPTESVTVQTSHLGKILSLLETDYIIFHGDSIYPNHAVREWLDKQVDIFEVSRTTLEIPIPYAMAEPRDLPGYQTRNVPLVLIPGQTLDRIRETKLVINYTIPPEVADRGGTGVFWTGFGLALTVLPGGSQPSVEQIGVSRLAESFVSRQALFTHSSGQAEFVVRIPETSMARAADVYAWYYGGAFEPLSPAYFVGRLPISPPDYHAEFVLYENRYSALPVFVTKRPMRMLGGFEELLLAAQLADFDIRDWAIRLDSASSSAPVIDRSAILVTNGSRPPSGYLGIQDVLILADPLRLLKDEIRFVDDESAAIPVAGVGYAAVGEISHTGESRVLSRSNRSWVVLNYSIPQEVFNQSKTETFSESFGLAFEILPAGAQPPILQLPEQRIAESFWEEQRQMENGSGQVAFSVDIPNSYPGSAVDIYGWYYGSAFGALSPYYYVDRWLVKGVYNSSSYGYEIARGGTLRLTNATVPITVNIPTDGTYTVALKVEGLVEVGKDSVLQRGIRDGDWTTFGPFPLSAGDSTFAIESKENSFVGTLLLYRGSPSLGSTRQALRPSVSPAVIRSYEQLSPTEWKVVVDATGPFFLALTEPYDPLWQATLGSTTIASEPLHGMINGFWVDSSGTFELRLEYSLQTYLEGGILVSLTSMVLAVTVVALPALRRQLRRCGQT